MLMILLLYHTVTDADEVCACFKCCSTCTTAKEVKFSVKDEYKRTVVTNECVCCLFISYECYPFNRKVVVIECITVNNDLICIAYYKCINVRNVVRICCATNCTLTVNVFVFKSCNFISCVCVATSTCVCCITN